MYGHLPLCDALYTAWLEVAAYLTEPWSVQVH